MANNLQVNEGTSGKFVRTIDTGSGVHVPLDGLILDDGNGSWSPIQRRANAIRMSLENDEVGIASENTLSSIDSAIGDHTTASEVRDPSTAATLLERVTGIDSMIWDALAGGNATDQLRVDLENNNADLLTKTKFDSVVNGSNELKTNTSLSSLLVEAKDQSGTNQPIEVADDGSGNMLLRVQLDNDAAGLAEDSTLADQESYDAINIGPATDSVFSTAYNGLLLASVDGDVEIQTGDGNTKTIPQSFFTAGQVLPITVAEISSTNTTQTVSDIMLVRN
jgi:hypothetical protein